HPVLSCRRQLGQGLPSTFSTVACRASRSRSPSRKLFEGGLSRGNSDRGPGGGQGARFPAAARLVHCALRGVAWPDARPALRLLRRALRYPGDARSDCQGVSFVTPGKNPRKSWLFCRTKCVNCTRLAPEISRGPSAAWPFGLGIHAASETHPGHLPLANSHINCLPGTFP